MRLLVGAGVLVWVLAGAVDLLHVLRVSILQAHTIAAFRPAGCCGTRCVRITAQPITCGLVFAPATTTSTRGGNTCDQHQSGDDGSGRAREGGEHLSVTPSASNQSVESLVALIVFLNSMTHGSRPIILSSPSVHKHIVIDVSVPTHASIKPIHPCIPSTHRTQ